MIDNFLKCMAPVVCSLSTLLAASPAFAGTAAYRSECSFIRGGPDRSGDVIKMPCYIIEGGHAFGAFFNILWRDGTYTVMSSNFQTGEEIGNFNQLVYQELYATPEGDLISIGELDYTNERYDVTEPDIAERVWMFTE